MVASVVSHSIFEPSIRLLEDAARSSPSRPTIAHDGIAGEASAGTLMTRARRANCGDLGTPPRQILCMTAPEFMPGVTAVWTDRSGDLGEQRSGYHDNAKGDILWSCKVEHNTY